MDKASPSLPARLVPHQVLYPPIEPHATWLLDVGDGHRIHVEECGNPQGIPVVVLHGGPGGGCSPVMRRYFDPRAYRIVLFDQRGCGRSRPHACVEANTTWHLVADIERIRVLLGIEAWGAVFGGSWGAALALIYAQAHPERVRALVLRGVFLMTQAELDWFYGGGAGAFWPDLWDRFRSLIPAAEQDDLIAAYHRRLFSGDLREEIRHARAWAGWENALASLESEAAGSVAGPGHAGTAAPVFEAPADYARAFARIENHYFANGGFLSEDQAILANMDRIAHIPGVIVQGRYDMICPPVSAWRLAQVWPAARLEMIGRAGHALSEPGITAALVRAMDRLAAQIAGAVRAG
ncbi:proline iminopeptidase, Neisseria-type subfamily [Rubellimicrobium thermophilum DSM 16684]|uniref:Proline iminopeptidase n=1 Tax=Rubellimicrobium thermophilum DSM 16684 TaxID=1123069 RepID=S9QXI9_9RHOB|nr:prolyl aminopeptidase [Rubellimicrobium thermophilum]EPX84363.1 proline iminopeptidase, Neisseria-type subfamily [Rubellimicrobium thermophilum DSM 16684]